MKIDFDMLDARSLRRCAFRLNVFASLLEQGDARRSVKRCEVSGGVAGVGKHLRHVSDNIFWPIEERGRWNV